jgi:hypothetical protein
VVKRLVKGLVDSVSCRMVGVNGDGEISRAADSLRLMVVKKLVKEM